MPRPKGIKERQPRKPRPRKLIVPGEASWRRLWRGGHYAEKGLSLELFKQLGSQPCHYCGAAPRLTNSYGLTYDAHRTAYSNPKKACSYEWWNERWIYANGVDKMIAKDDYCDTSNLVACCHTCNFMKQRMGHDEFIAHCGRIAAWHADTNTIPAPHST